MNGIRFVSLPVIDRELRVQARKRSTYYSRSIWGIVAGGVLALVLKFNPEMATNGSQMFALLHGALACMFLLLPALTSADSISRERREGTLGLLLLTPLTATQVVISKIFTDFWRLFYIWLMMVPFLMMPVLVGGVTMNDFLVSIGILFAILITGVAAGFVVSALSVNFGAAVIRALVLAAILNLALSALVTNFPFFTLPVKGGFGFGEPNVVRILILGPYYVIAPTVINDFFQSMFTVRNLFEKMAAGHAAASLILLFVAVAVSSWRVAHLAESTAQARRKETFRRRFLTPILWKKQLRRSLSPKLDRNPFGWLESRTPTARIGLWIGVLGLILVETLLIVEQGGMYSVFSFQFPLLFLLVLTMALKSAASFQYEKENGAFELILVTPITEKSLVQGRLRAVWRYYFPLAVVIAIFVTLGLYWRGFQIPFFNVRQAVNFANYWMSLISVPAAGLFFALRFKTFIPALFWTLGLAVFGIPFVFSCLQNLLWYANYRQNSTWAGAAIELIDMYWWPIIVAVIACHLLLARAFAKMSAKLLKRRTFAEAR